MKVIKKIKEMQTLANKLRCDGKIIGFVPTMGFFHKGHLSLMKIARRKADIVVVSNFVNPLQFGPAEDLNKYPQDIKRDTKLAESIGVDFMFIPSSEEMYPDNFSTYIEVKRLDKYLCGASRPGHFKGVVTVCSKLFNIVNPHFVVFGQKDAQQAFIIRRLIRDLNFNIELIIAPIVREADGLAMSSRNLYLDDKQRKEAICLYKSLKLAEKLIFVDGVRDTKKIIKNMEQFIKETVSSANIDYISIVDTKELKPIDKLSGEVLIALAVWIGKARLIDNTIIKV